MPPDTGWSDVRSPKTKGTKAAIGTIGRANVAKNVLSNTPPELSSDIIDRGIVLTGGGALLRGIDEYLTRQTGVPVYRADNPLITVATGCGRALQDPAIMRRLAQTNYL